VKLPNEERLIGPPGCGKTTTLASILAYNAKQYGSDSVIAVSHTKAAAAEIVGRKTMLPKDNVGTLHSFAFQALNNPTIAEDTAHLREFADSSRYQFSGCNDVEELEFTASGSGDGDILLSEYGRLRNMCISRDFWQSDVLSFAKEWEAYKTSTETMDFADLIERAALDTSAPYQEPNVICLDEAQDTSRLQWQLLNKWGQQCEKIVTCGDVDQTIYGWAGADVNYFLENKPARQKVLEQSYRVPIAIHSFAQSWVRQIKNREDVVYKPRDYPGEVLQNNATFKQPGNLLHLIEDALENNKTIMLQASCEFMLKPLITILRKEGLPFANPWRKKHGGWNPLQKRKTVNGLIEFLKPQLTGTLWDKQSYEKWLVLVKGLFKRGGRETFLQNALTIHTPDELFEQLSRHIENEEDLSMMLTGLPHCTDWLYSKLLAANKGPAEYPLRCVEQRGIEAIHNEPKIYVGTCHSFKGSEADIVVLFPDLSTQGYNEYIGNGFDETIRLFYVGITRARETLHLCAPATRCAVWG